VRCNPVQLVADGKVVNASSKVSDIVSNEITFPIDVDFSKNSNEIIPGDYYGQFTILFSPDI
ncbi:hypothetical protein, partial [Photobacterium damselae]|uniref:hypothetical protein n=1 Tax=Photobacterium damselae TaxID=38293 RepID=UPI001EFCFB2F